ncbi:hypothetical protein HQN89_33575 [Paenibacillus frigoriresistens]|uniref:hypothetical protein n=1 Tax=Paenibacillus alginolyticus TaxID=59839 RepID=UPI001563CF6D|nr:hypothetical protein [Paenibacillus frigoriresistens]NRF95759.1 hypothetical protein [Paenibacillus frigoriresistens]
MVLTTAARNEIILHVGLHKSGSSSIQETLFLKKNNFELEKMGYLYPKCWQPNHSMAIYSAFCDDPTKYHGNIRLGYSAAQLNNLNKNNLIDLMNEIAESKFSKLIISGEDISLLSLDNLNELKKYLTSICTYQIKVIIYVRHPVYWAISSIQQFIKNGRQNYNDALLQMDEIIGNLFVDRIDKFVHVFGRESVNVYSFEEAILNELGPVGHFLSAIGIDDDDLSKFNIVNANQSISLIAGEIISYINEKLPLFRDGKLNEHRSNGDTNPFVNIKGSKFDIPFSNKKKIWEKSYDDIQWLKNNWDIDYSNVKIIQTDDFNSGLSEEIIEDIHQASFEVSEKLRDLVLEYLQVKLKKKKRAGFLNRLWRQIRR